MGKKDKIALVLKDNAYGHGIEQMAKLAKSYGITKAIVRCNPEAQMVKEYFDYILVLSDIPQVADERVVYTINALEAIPRFVKGSRVELKVDTGMHRNGVAIDAIDEAIATCKKAGLKLEGIFTHFRSADELSSEWFWQKERFEAIKRRYKEEGFRFHSANSAALFREKRCSEDMVRVGIAAYGCLDMPSSFNLPTLRPVLSLVAEKVATRELKEGEAVGYGATFRASKAMSVSTYDIGYADGFSRALSNNFSASNGAELVGRVSMDNSSFTCKDEHLELFDDARVVAKRIDTIAYEVLVALKPYIERRVI